MVKYKLRSDQGNSQRGAEKIAARALSRLIPTPPPIEKLTLRCNTRNESPARIYHLMPDVMKKQIYVWKIKTALTCFQAQLSVIQDPMWCWSWWSTDLLDWWSPTGEPTKLNTGKTHLPLEPFSTQCSHTKTDVITKRGKSLKKPMINQSEPCKLPEARVNARGQGVFGFSLPSD